MKIWSWQDTRILHFLLNWSFLRIAVYFCREDQQTDGGKQPLFKRQISYITYPFPPINQEILHHTSYYVPSTYVFFNTVGFCCVLVQLKYYHVVVHAKTTSRRLPSQSNPRKKAKKREQLLGFQYLASCCIPYPAARNIRYIAQQWKLSLLRGHRRVVKQPINNHDFESKTTNRLSLRFFRLFFYIICLASFLASKI